MQTITRDELKAAVDARRVTVVEALAPMYYADAHIPGAVNIPHTQVQELAPRLLPDKSAPIVTYCSNTACPYSEIAARALEELGYTNVRKYPGGKEDWRDAGLPLEQSAVAA